MPHFKNQNKKNIIEIQLFYLNMMLVTIHTYKQDKYQFVVQI